VVVGYWVDDSHCLGIEASGFILSRRNVTLDSDTGLNTLTFPFSFAMPGTGTGGTGTGAAAPNLVLTTDAQAHLSVTSSTKLWGGELNARSGTCCFGPLTFEGFLGFRYVDLEEGLTSNEAIALFPPVVGGVFVPGGIPNNPGLPLVFNIFDDIQTRNQFYGAQLGGTIDWRFGCFFLNGTGSIGLGDMHQSVNLLGGSASLAAGTPSIAPGGLITSADDLGHHSREHCAFVSEWGIKFGYSFGCHLRAFVGYNALFLSSVVRPPDQVSFSRTNLQVTVNGTPQTINVLSPGFRFNASEVWVQGCDFGVEVRF
jgi:hypothetical protein